MELRWFGHSKALKPANTHEKSSKEFVQSILKELEIKENSSSTVGIIL